MKLDKVVSWYQKKISTYDKQQWEKTVEQRILRGIQFSVPLTNTELKSELIDVDLVRGSSFPKAKPKQSLGTVLKLAILRYIFLPLYARWWVEQTSPRVFTLLLFLYGLQMWCWGVYSYNVNRDSAADSEHIVSMIDLIIPMSISLVLSMIHSQIVATASITNDANAVKRNGVVIGTTASSASAKKHRRMERVRRKRKVATLIRRGSDLKFPLTVDTVNHEHLGTVYIHQPIHGQVPEHDDEQPDDEQKSVPMSSKSDGLRKRIVNFSRPTTTANNVAPPTVHVPDVVRNARSDSSEERITRVDDTTSAPYHESVVASPADGVADGAGKSRKRVRNVVADSSDDTDDEGGVEPDSAESPRSPLDSSNNATAGIATEGTTSATEWTGITTNSEEENSYTSELEASDSHNECSDYAGDCDFAPTVILNPCCGTNDRISCTIWEHSQTKKAEMSVLDISSAIIERVHAIPDTPEYVYIGLVLSIVLSFVPVFCRLCEAAANIANSSELHVLDIPAILMENASSSSGVGLMRLAFGTTAWEQSVLMVAFFLRICLTFLLFFVLSVAERTFKQRFLYAKLFSHLTSSRRARKSKVPHFRLNKVRNIKIWLSVRSYLKRRGPQRSVDVIVSTAFILTLLFLSFLSVEWLKDSVHLQSQYNLEALTWSCCLGCFLLRFMTLGTKITRKYRCLSVLITEQINLYLQIEQKPHKKEELMLANSVLKLAADLLKELESPFKISGLSANPYLYTTIKVVILSALSGVLSEILGFKLKLHKIKIK